MPLTQHDLYERIRQFSFASAGESAPFQKRLAADQGWSVAFASEVEKEYRRFAYLATIARNEITPSVSVDMAWHQHLADSANYSAFCRVLGKPLEHKPGGQKAGEKTRFASQYDATLGMYQREFGSAPSHIWPGAQRTFGHRSNPTGPRVAGPGQPRKATVTQAMEYAAIGAAVLFAYGLFTRSAPVVIAAFMAFAAAMIVRAIMTEQAKKRDDSSGSSCGSGGCSSSGDSSSSSSDSSSDSGSDSGGGDGGGGCGGGGD